MRFVFFCHSLVSDWNHGNAHFLRGVCSELQAQGHQVRVFEPADSWSRKNLVAAHGVEALEGFHRAYPHLHSNTYDLASFDLDEALEGADVVLVHEWSAHELVRRVGAHRKRHRYVLLFHDTHHRGVTDPATMAAYDLTNFDGVLAFGEVLRELYLENGWCSRAFTWHEAADTRVFKPIEGVEPSQALVWIGNWGDDERTHELEEMLLEPVRSLGLASTVYGVRYPDDGLAALRRAGISYGGWLPNHRVPEVMAEARVTVHVPRRPYVQQLPGTPTIRVFEALACGIPLVSSSWHDIEGLFVPGEDFLLARSGEEMRSHLRAVVSDSGLAKSLRQRGRETVLAKHTCAHRVDALLEIVDALGAPVPTA